LRQINSTCKECPEDSPCGSDADCASGDCGVRARRALTFSAVEFETRALGGDPAWADAATAWGVTAAKFTSLHSLGGAQCQPSAAGTTCSLIPGAIGAASCQVAGGPSSCAYQSHAPTAGYCATTLAAAADMSNRSACSGLASNGPTNRQIAFH
jgi:hypothetical protein